MPATLPLGNDVVDIGLADNRNSAGNPRFADRVLATEELGSISILPRIDRVFWAFWSAKETAYKTLIKIDPQLVFAHRRFVVYPEADIEWAAGNGNGAGIVVHDNRTIPVRWAWRREWIHCLTGSRGKQTRYRVATVSDCRRQVAFEALKTASGQSDASVAVRVIALSLLAECGFDDLQIVREPTAGHTAPPRVMQNGQLLEQVDISLSHDGVYAAAAVRSRPGGQVATEY